MPRVGDPLVLAVLLEAQEDNLFVRALLTDEDNNPLPISPVDLPYRAAGLYKNATYPYPDTSHVNAVYEIYEDAGYTEKSLYWPASACFLREDTLEDLVDEINDHTTLQVVKLASVDAELTIEQNEITVTVEQNMVTVELLEDKDLDAETDNDKLTASAASDNVEVEVDSSQVEATIDC